MKLLHEYKRALKRYISPEERDLKIQTLGLDRKSIKQASEIELYHKAKAVIADIKSWTECQNESATAYSGIEEFSNHLARSLEQYHIETDLDGKQKLIHTQRLVSRAMVDAVQLLSIPPEQLFGKSARQLDSCLQLIAKYGNKEQHELLMKTLKARKERHQQAIAPLVDSFRSYMQTKALVTSEYA